MYEFSIQYANQRAADFQREAAKHQLIQHVLEAREKRIRFYAPLLARVGRQFAEVGARLERRYTASLPEPQGVVHSRGSEVGQWN